MMDETTEIRTCDVCGLNPGEVVASGLGPVSYPCCKICLEQGAESIGVVCLSIFLRGGPESGENHGPGEWWLHEVKSYSEGRYIDWQEILTIYPCWEAHYIKD